MSWHTKPQCAFDLESTGIDVETERVVTACVAVIKPTPVPPWDIDIRSHLIDPGIDIPEGATAVHGITTAYAKEHGQPPAETLDVVAGDLALAMRSGMPVVGMNLAYDFTLLDRELRRYGLAALPERLGRAIGPVIDVYVIDKAIDPFRRGSRKLVNLCEHYGVRIDGAHDSTFDALASARIAFRIAQRAHMEPDALARLYADRRKPQEIVRAFAALRRLTLAELHDRQKVWRREQQESLADYLRGQGKDASDVDGSWPMRPWREPAVAGEVRP
ncbi:exonuclease domain-containing protein [Rhizomonospora bruguierae]|uniref:exonuclease domain-containing protein n=1 Tax=Rhizomonospora bruguierae TaxID=1581705 RepID=UPI001BCDC967|nr:exonuclease domain-containing protein [Micromonospora sp. NBRC 107566]